MADEEADQDNEELKTEAAPPVDEPQPGIIYISRIPPFMKPSKVRHIFSQYGEIGRVFLQPEDPSVRKRRKKFGGNKKQNYTEGWVEFKRKSVAKRVAMALNNTRVGGKKSNYHYDDIWNIKYLSKYTWTHLTEKLAYDRAVHRQRLLTEISQVKRETNHYLQSIDDQKAKEAIIERKRKAGTLEDRRVRKVKQRKLIKTAPTNELSENLLKKIFH